MRTEEDVRRELGNVSDWMNRPWWKGGWHWNRYFWGAEATLEWLLEKRESLDPFANDNTEPDKQVGRLTWVCGNCSKHYHIFHVCKNRVSETKRE